MNNFVLEQTITAPFVNSPLTTYFRRPSWTPDGTHIIAANAVNGPVTCAAIIKRGEWESEISFIGHEAPVEVCRCSPRLYSRSPGNNNTNNASKNGSVPTTSVIATASDDKALSIWTTNNARPLVVLQDLANKAFTDLAWSPDGLCLFATALDGTVIALRFDESGADLGTPLGLEENEKCLAKFGGNKLV
ncbi:HIR complex subunit, partial [Ascosphaera atra]